MTLAHHQSGCAMIADYFRKEWSLHPVLTEVSAGREVIDCIGFGPQRTAYVGDWKNSPADMKNHLQKIIVRRPEFGVGKLRIIFAREYVIEWESFGAKWPEWLGLIVLRDDGTWLVKREAEIIHQRDEDGEWEILRHAGSKSQQTNSVARQDAADKALALVELRGPMTAAQLRRDLGLDMPPSKLARILDRDRRLQQDCAGGEYRLAG